MTIDEACRAIPHKRTVFDHSSAKMIPYEADYMKSFLNLVERVMVERVRTLVWFHTNGAQGKGFTHYENRIGDLLEKMDSLKISPKLKKNHRLVIDAIKEQREFFKEQDQSIRNGHRFVPVSANQPLIKSFHHKLPKAYERLMGLYPNENLHNKQSFFDYLCALDFI